MKRILPLMLSFFTVVAFGQVTTYDYSGTIETYTVPPWRDEYFNSGLRSAGRK